MMKKIKDIVLWISNQPLERKEQLKYIKKESPMIKVNRKPINILIVFIICMTVACLDSDKFFAVQSRKL